VHTPDRIYHDSMNKPLLFFRFYSLRRPAAWSNLVTHQPYFWPSGNPAGPLYVGSGAGMCCNCNSQRHRFQPQSFSMAMHVGHGTLAAVLRFGLSKRSDNMMALLQTVQSLKTSGSRRLKTPRRAGGGRRALLPSLHIFRRLLFKPALASASASKVRNFDSVAAASARSTGAAGLGKSRNRKRTSGRRQMADTRTRGPHKNSVEKATRTYQKPIRRIHSRRQRR
jgi:hypothetical protein